jgi:hypothetical protein
MRLTRCDDVLRPFTGGRPGLIIIGEHDDEGVA